MSKILTGFADEYVTWDKVQKLTIRFISEYTPHISIPNCPQMERKFKNVNMTGAIKLRHFLCYVKIKSNST
jgi:hypothetical protein